MNPLVALAKSAVESFVKKGRITSAPDNLPREFLEKKSGTFVTIEKISRGLPRSQTKPRSRALRSHYGANLVLRGCVGTYLPTKNNVAEETIYNAVAAATEDYRFGPVQKDELPYLSYAVYILSEPELIKNTSELNPKKYGIIVKTTPIVSENKTNVVFDGKASPKSGLLLPNLEGIETPAQQVSIACQKGKIDPILEAIIIYKFTVEKYAQ